MANVRTGIKLYKLCFLIGLIGGIGESSEHVVIFNIFCHLPSSEEPVSVGAAVVDHSKEA